MPQLLLLQFPISHYCEKVRWVLDHKRLPYRVKNQFPGAHALTNRRLVGSPSVPVLLDGHHAIGDSSEIALYLDDQFPDQRLIPPPGEARASVLGIETFFDEEIGPAVRRLIYSYVTPRPRLFRGLFFAEYDGFSRTLGSVAATLLSKEIGRMYRVREGSIEESLAAIERGFARLEQDIAGDPERYLVGESLTLADVTVASLLGPLLGPVGSPWSLPLDIPPLLALRERLRERPGGAWVLARYARDRRVRPSAAPAGLEHRSA